MGIRRGVYDPGKLEHNDKKTNKKKRKRTGNVTQTVCYFFYEYCKASGKRYIRALSLYSYVFTLMAFLTFQLLHVGGRGGQLAIIYYSLLILLVY